jgi:hypothetical protein
VNPRALAPLDLRTRANIATALEALRPPPPESPRERHTLH